MRPGSAGFRPATLRFATGCLLVLGAVFLATQFVANEYAFFAAFVVLQFVALATAWNVLGGYGGYVNFGSGAFLALGAYAAIVLQKSLGAPLPVQVLAGGAAAGLLGLALGAMTLRLQGIFFSIATFAVSVILETAILNWDYVGGARGITVIRPLEAPVFGTYARMLVFAMAVVAVGAVATARAIETSTFGRGLRAIRDNERAAAACGVPVLGLKVAAAGLSGALMGAAGAPLPLYMNYVDPSSAFNLNYAVSALAMPMIGGTSHWIGPVVGALVLGGLQQFVSVTVSSEVNVLVVGLLLIGAVVFAPKGLVGLVEEAVRRARARRAEVAAPAARRLA